MRYPCNLYGQPASPWLFWSKEPPHHFHPTCPLRPWLSSEAKDDDAQAIPSSIGGTRLQAGARRRRGDNDPTKRAARDDRA